MLWGHSSLRPILMLKHYLTDLCQRSKVMDILTWDHFKCLILSNTAKVLLHSHIISLFSILFVYCIIAGGIWQHNNSHSTSLRWTHNLHEHILQNNRVRMNVHLMVFADLSLLQVFEVQVEVLALINCTGDKLSCQFLLLVTDHPVRPGVKLLETNDRLCSVPAELQRCREGAQLWQERSIH